MRAPLKCKSSPHVADQADTRPCTRQRPRSVPTSLRATALFLTQFSAVLPFSFARRTPASSTTLFGLSLLVAAQHVDAVCPAGTTATSLGGTDCVAVAELQVAVAAGGATFNSVAELCNGGESCDTCCTRQSKVCNAAAFGTAPTDPSEGPALATAASTTCSYWSSTGAYEAPYKAQSGCLYFNQQYGGLSTCAATPSGSYQRFCACATCLPGNVVSGASCTA